MTTKYLRAFDMVYCHCCGCWPIDTMGFFFHNYFWSSRLILIFQHKNTWWQVKVGIANEIFFGDPTCSKTKTGKKMTINDFYIFCM